MAYSLDLQQFIALARPGKRLPLVKKVALGEDTPLSLLEKLRQEGKPCVFLESGQGGQNSARYSFVAANPLHIFRSKGEKVEILGPGGRQEITTSHPYKALEEFVASFPVVTYPGLPKFYGGALGLVSYDLVRFFERLPEKAVDDLALPDLCFLMADEVLVLDHRESTLEVVVNALVEEGRELQAIYEETVDRIETLLQTLSEGRTQPPPRVEAKAWERRFQPQANVSQARFEAMVEQAKAYIGAGDVFQVNLSLRLGTPLTSRPLDLYRVLREINPSPYMAYMDFGDLQLVGSSPELLVRVTGEVAETRPIAGTRRRGGNREEDLALARELISNEKERAEHIMLVDLERNDLGRVCRYGTVEVDELMVIEEYSHVMHLVSHVRGILAPGKTSFDLLQACFPGGTITGCPKVRCMEIIEELEPTRRGVYTGSLGYFGYGGEMEMNISIRTLVVKDGMAYVQAGAGIVADSIPEKEYYESMKKAEALLRALEIAGELYPWEQVG